MDRIIADRLYTLINVMNENNKEIKEMVESNKRIERALNNLDNTRRK